MTDNINKYLKERSNLTKYFYKNGQRESDHNKEMKKSAKCTREIFEAEGTYILQIINKTYWTILNCLLYNIKIFAIPPLEVCFIFLRASKPF